MTQDMTPAAIIAAFDAKAERAETPCGEGTMMWRRWGRGSPLVLVHGGHGSWTQWLRNIEAFARHHTVWVPDLPGYGDSEMPPPPYTIQTMADIMAAGLMRIIDRDTPMDIVGFSAGGRISGPAALILGDRLRTLIVVSPGGLGAQNDDFDMKKLRGLTDPAEIEAAQRHNLAAVMFADPANIDALALYSHSENIRRARIRYERPPMDALPTALRDMKGRLHSIWSDRDGYHEHYLADRQAVLKELRPEAGFRVILGAGHWVMYEAPDAFHATVAELLAS